ncbi:MAG: type III pantothenate kinase [Nitrosomonas sp.]|jgi:type III pantothenate kinase
MHNVSYLLVIDSGNSALKWGIHDGYQWLQKGIGSYECLSTIKNEFRNLLNPSAIIISHVSHAITKQQINQLISIWPTEAYWIVSQSAQCGVFNSYQNATQLGSDRWASLIAAWKIVHEACLVINVGTAMTVDALSDNGKFMGGIILPGANVMRHTLSLKTQLINPVLVGTYKNLPTNTDDAIYSGVIYGLIGSIERFYNLFSFELGRPFIRCVISGGDAHVLIPFMKFPIKHVEHLVLEGLVILAKDLQLFKDSSIY